MAISCGLPAEVSCYALGEYRAPARDIVLAYKERDRRDLAPMLGRLLAEACAALLEVPAGRDEPLWLVPAPSRRSAARSRGGPHMLRVARQCARRLAELGCPAAVAPALRLSWGARDAAGVDRASRDQNLAGRVRVAVDGLPPLGASAVLLDDVVTTGATARACVQALAGAGIGVTAVVALTSAGSGTSASAHSLIGHGPLGRQ